MLFFSERSETMVFSFSKERQASMTLTKPLPYTVKKVGAAESEKVIEFMIEMRKELFPMLIGAPLPSDLLHFKRHYIESKNAQIFAAFLPDGTVIGTIGIGPYDHRFPKLHHHYDQLKTAEIVKCYIDSTCRRQGIGTALYKKALRFCQEKEYEMLYLHTHPFLPGGIPFWLAQGFEERLIENDPIWKTRHMDLQIK